MRSERGVAIATVAALAFTAAACTNESSDAPTPSSVSASTTVAPDVQVTSAITFPLDIDPPRIVRTHTGLHSILPEEQASPVDIIDIMFGTSEKPGALLDLSGQDHIVGILKAASQSDYVDTHRRSVNEATDMAPVFAPIAGAGDFNLAEVAFKSEPSIGRVTRLRLGNTETEATLIQYARKVITDGVETDELIGSFSVVFNPDGSREATAAIGIPVDTSSSLLTQAERASGALLTEPDVVGSEWQEQGDTGNSGETDPSSLVRTFQRDGKVVGQQSVTVTGNQAVVAVTASA